MVWSPPPFPVLLAQGEVHLWRAPLDLAGPDLAELRRTLSPDESARAARFRFPAAQDRFAAARGSLRTILARYCHADPAAIEFGCGPAGKPYLASGQGPEFSVSHSHSWALYGIASGREIGVDLERIGKPALDHERIAERFFTSGGSRIPEVSSARDQTRILFSALDIEGGLRQGAGRGAPNPAGQLRSVDRARTA